MKKYLVLLVALLASPVAAQNYPSSTFKDVTITSPAGKTGGAVFTPTGKISVSPRYDVSSYGFVNDGTTDNSAAMTTLLSAVSAGAKGGQIKFPCGSYRFTTSVAITIPTQSNVSIDGGGCTKLLFGNTDGLVLTYTDNSSWVSIRNLEISTSVATGTNTAIWLKSTVVNVPQNARSSFIEHVHVNGSDSLGGTNYWGKGIFQDKVSFVNVSDYTFNGRGSFGGIGILAQGDIANTEFNVVTNVVNSNFAYCTVGFQYGSYYQGLSFVGSNITGCERGIYSPTGNVFNLQASISSSQFSNGVSSIEFASPMSDLQIVGNTILLNGPASFGIKTAGIINGNIVGNVFHPAFVAGNGNAISVGSSADVAEAVAIIGNNCLSSATCISIASGAKGVASGNTWHNVTSPYQNLSSTFYQFNNTASGVRVASQAGPLSGVSYSDTVTVNNVLGSKTNPAIASGFCTTPSIVVPNGTWSFRIAVGSACATGTGVVTMPTAANGWDCKVTSGTASATSVPVMDLTASTATTVNIKNYARSNGAPAAFASGDVLLVNCVGQ